MKSVHWWFVFFKKKNVVNTARRALHCPWSEFSQGRLSSPGNHTPQRILPPDLASWKPCILVSRGKRQKMRFYLVFCEKKNASTNFSGLFPMSPNVAAWRISPYHSTVAWSVVFINQWWCSSMLVDYKISVVLDKLNLLDGHNSY